MLSLRTFRKAQCPHYPSRFFETDCLPLRSGRAAITQALRLSGVGPGDEVLLPAYHCGSMVEPALWLGARVVFFHIYPDLTVNLEDLEAKLTPRSRALVVPHYFGFPQPLDELLTLRERHGFKLIEDCAHALFGADGDNTLGSRGDFAITSTCKWFPAPEGGALCANPPRELAGRFAPQHASLPLELRAALSIAREATRYGRLPLVRPLVRLADLLNKSPKAPIRPETIAKKGPSGRFRWLQPETITDGNSRSAVWILGHASHEAAAHRRRENYRYLLERSTGFRRADALFPRLREPRFLSSGLG